MAYAFTELSGQSSQITREGRYVLDRRFGGRSWHRCTGVIGRVQPEPMETEWIDRVDRLCPDCGRPIEAPAATQEPFRICRACCDAYVEKAGR
jgi:hypothetical protein